MSSDHRRALAEVALWLVPAVWSSNYLIARAAPGHVSPHVLAFGRWGIVCLVLLTWCAPALARKRGEIWREAPRLVALGALGMWICGAWVYLAGRSTTATNIGLIYAASPVGIAIAGTRLLGEPLGLRQALAMAASLAGVVLIVIRGDLAVLARLDFVAGDLLIVVATISWTAYSLLLRLWPSALTPLERLCVIAAGGLLVLAPFTIYEWTHSAPPTAHGLRLILLAGLLPGLTSYLAYSYMQRELGVARAGLVLYLSPLYAAGLAWALLGERPGWFHVVGAILILPGVRFSAPPRKPQASARTAHAAERS